MLQKIKRYAALLLVLALVCCALPAAAMAADAAPTTVKLAAGETTLAFLNTGSGDGLYCYNGWGDGSKAMDQSQSVNGDGAFVPLYYYWVKGGQPVDVDPDMPPQYSPNAQFDLSKWLDFKTVDVYITNLDKTVKMWSVQLKPTATASATHNGKLTFVDADGGLTTVNFFMAEDHGTIGSIAVTDAFRLETVLQNSYRQEWSNLLSVYYDGIAPSTEYFYLYTKMPTAATIP